MLHGLWRHVVTLLLAFAFANAGAADLIVEKKTHVLSRFTTDGGRTLRDVRIGYETYGTLNAAKDNAIFIPHMFLGSSHAAGKYRTEDAEPGYWDSIIGPGKAIDTNRYFVISADTIANTNARDPTVVTTGPLSVDPATGKIYGPTFPALTLRDSVRAHKALLDSLGVRRLQAVGGWSMGALQAYEWAASYPDIVARVIAVGGSAQSTGAVIGWMNSWVQALMLDPKWNGGNYAPGQEPVAGLSAAIQGQLMAVAHHAWIDAAFGRQWADKARDPRVDPASRYLWETQQAGIGGYFAGVVDANSYVLSIRAVQNFTVGGADTLEAGLAKVRAPTLVIGVPTDVLVAESALRRDVDVLQRAGVRARYVALEGAMGHLEGRYGIARVADAIRTFLGE